MKDLEERCKNEKYFQMVRFFYHRLPKEDKRNFILEVASFNVLLAAQCAMSDSKDENIEKDLRELAINAAEKFSDANNSTYGLMAMAELGQYSMILKLFEGISKPTKSHIRILSKVFSEVDQTVFINFIDTLSHYKNFAILMPSMSAFKGRCTLDQDSIPILKKVMDRFLKKGNTGFIKTFFTKHELWNSTDLLLEGDLSNIIKENSKGAYSGIHFSYLISEHNNLSESFPIVFFLDALAKHDSKKALNLSFKLAIKANMFDHKQFNNTVHNLLLSFVSKKSKLADKRKMKYLMSHGFRDYIDNVPELLEIFNSIDSENYISPPKAKSDTANVKLNLLLNENLGVTAASVFGQGQKRVDVLNEYSMREYWDTIFNYILATANNVPLEDLIAECTLIYQKDYKEVCQYLRNYDHFGEIVAIKDYGYYIKPFTFYSSSNCFLHKLAIPDNIRELSLFDKNDVISFKIVGINLETRRINVNLIH